MNRLQFLVAACLTVASVHGQGTVVFNNLASTSYRLWTNNVFGTASNLMSGVNHYRIGLYVSTDLAASFNSLTLAAMTTNSGIPALAGYFNGGSALPLPGIAAGTQIRFQIRAWTLAAGTTFEEALINIAVSGISPLGTVTLGGGVTPPGALFGTLPGQLSRGFEIPQVPEPSASALAIIGAIALLLGRSRRKRARHTAN